MGTSEVGAGEADVGGLLCSAHGTTLVDADVSVAVVKLLIPIDLSK